jgi:hypothetical protein
MPATVTLATATLTFGVGPGDNEITLSSLSGVVPGYCLWIDRELMQVKELKSSTRVRVVRGESGTFASAHSSSATVTIGRCDQFYSVDPQGRPGETFPVSPYINVINGKVWMAQGDAISGANRWWQEVTQTYGTGPFGIRTQEASISAST